MWVQLREVRSEEAKKIRRERKDKDFSPRRGKVLEPRTDNLAATIGTSLTKDNLLIWIEEKNYEIL